MRQIYKLSSLLTQLKVMCFGVRKLISSGTEVSPNHNHNCPRRFPPHSPDRPTKLLNRTTPIQIPGRTTDQINPIGSVGSRSTGAGFPPGPADPPNPGPDHQIPGRSQNQNQNPGSNAGNSIVNWTQLCFLQITDAISYACLKT
jgi:hypothetical protein